MFSKYFQGGQFKSAIRADEKVIIITGSNTGIGKATALDLARRGARVYMACRDPMRCEEARQEIIKETGNEQVFNRQLDLSSMESVRQFAAGFLKEESRLDVLINNAGIGKIDKQMTKDGLDLVMAINHFGPFLLTNLLVDLLKASAPSRIVTVSSLSHKWGKLEKNNLNNEKSYSKFKIESKSQLANVLFTTEIARRLEATGVTANYLHPGGVRTEIIRNQPAIVRALAYLFVPFLKTPMSGAQTSLALALDPSLEKVTGKYFVDCKIRPDSTASQDRETANWLWEKSEALTGLTQ